MRIIFSLFILMTVTVCCYADIIYLKNGRQIEAKIVSQDEEKIWVIIFDGTKMAIDRADIKEIVPKDFVIKQRTAAKDAKAAKKELPKTTYGTMTAEVTYTKGPQTKDQSTADYTVGSSQYTLTQYRDGKPVTFQRQTYNTGALKTEARMEGGVRQGSFRSLYENGALLKETGFYRDDKKNGIFKEYWPNGKLKSEILYKEDKEQGLARFYHENGLPAKEVSYLDGKKDGIEKSYYDTGQLEAVQMYVNGKAVGVTEKYYPNGELKAKISLAEGKTTEYFKDGKIKSMMSGLENKYIEYDQEGNVLYEGMIPESKKVPQEPDVSPAVTTKQ